MSHLVYAIFVIAAGGTRTDSMLSANRCFASLMLCFTFLPSLLCLPLSPPSPGFFFLPFPFSLLPLFPLLVIHYLFKEDVKTLSVWIRWRLDQGAQYPSSPNAHGSPVSLSLPAHSLTLFFPSTLSFLLFFILRGYTSQIQHMMVKRRCLSFVVFPVPFSQLSGNSFQQKGKCRGEPFFLQMESTLFFEDKKYSHAAHNDVHGNVGCDGKY